MIHVEPFLIFNGDCEEAFTFYEHVFGAKKEQMMRFRDVPERDKMNVPEKDMDRLVYVGLKVGNIVLMGSDSPSNMPVKFGDNISISIGVGSAHEAEHIYKKLSAGGKVIMPLGKTFFAELYAMFTDKFGVCWMVNYMPEGM